MTTEHIDGAGGLPKAVLDVMAELRRARIKFPAYNSAHEGYAVIKEELDELWEEVRTKNKSIQVMRDEAMQVACTAIRFMEDVCDQ